MQLSLLWSLFLSLITLPVLSEAKTCGKPPNGQKPACLERLLLQRLKDEAPKNLVDDLGNELLEDVSNTSNDLPEICKTWSKSDAESCIDKCYELEVGRESDQETEEMWWDAAGSVFDGAFEGASAGAGALIQEEQLVSLKKEEKFIFTAIAGVALVGTVVSGVGSAFVEEGHAQDNLNAQNCEQLSAVLMSRSLVSIEANQEVMLDRIDESISRINDVNNRLIKFEDSVKRMEQGLLHTLQQNHQLLSEMRLESLTTDFLRCVGTIKHQHAAAQGIMSDYQSIKKSFRLLAESGTDMADQSVKWLKSMTKWEQDLPGRVDLIATSALDGLQCVSALLSRSDLLRLYLAAQLKRHMKATVQQEGWTTSRDLLNHFQKMQLDTMKGMLTDNLLPLFDAAVTQTRFILALAPRPGYWEEFSLHLQSMKEELSSFLVSGELWKFSYKVMLDVLDENAAQLFPVRDGCVKALSTYSEAVVDTSHMTVWKEQGDKLVIAERLSSMIVDSMTIKPRQGRYFSCNSEDHVWTQAFAYEDASIHGTHGLPSIAASEDDFKVERMSMEQPWHCAARTFAQKSAAADRFSSCLAEQKTVQTCGPQSALTCPAEMPDAEFRCTLSGCPHASSGVAIHRPCTNVEGKLMDFLAHNDKKTCQNACLLIKKCGASLYSKSSNKCTLFPVGHDCQLDYSDSTELWFNWAYTPVVEG